jgi:hypothetical protein
MSKKSLHYKLFFSWQSDDQKSRRILENALLNAVDFIRENEGIEIEIDHSTLGESGMPSIDQTILRKIDNCDIFLADVTPIHNYPQTLGNGQSVTKECPNSNVLLELGYAMSALGVNYVIPVAHQGSWIPANLPFDINHRTIYSFTSSGCNLVPCILDVVKYIKEHGRHRHLDKPYWVYLIRKICAKFLPQKRYKKANDVICEESTVFFKGRMAGAFPGSRGLIEYKKARDIHRHLAQLLEAPLHFRRHEIGTIDPIWWFRGGSAMDIDSFRWLGGRRCVMGWNELKIRRIVAYVDSGRYYSNYVYVEAEAQKPTGLDKNMTSEHIKELKKHMNIVDEEYAIYKPSVFFRKRVTKQEEDDGATKVFGKLVRMKRDHIETRCRFLTDFNFIIAAKGSAFNCNEFNRTSEDFFEGLLNGSVTIKELNEYLMRFPKPSLDF